MKKSLIAMLVVAGAAIAGFARAVGEKVNDAVFGYMANRGMILGTITLTESKTDNSQMYKARHLDDAGSPAAAVFYPGFRPRYVRIVNVTDRITYEWEEGMLSTTYVLTVAAGTRTLVTDSVLSVVVAEGSRPSITLAAAATLQNKQYSVTAQM